MGIRGAIEDIQPFAELAQNATTLVYKAYQQSLERFVLLKRLRPEFSTDEDLSARFQEEARLIARVPHPNIVSIYSYGSDSDGAYMVAEYVEGGDLEALIERCRIPAPIALFILLESARGLKAAHDKDILHRDLKPSNILISTEGEVKLSDFGFASISGSASPGEGEIRGTLPYLAPEQVLGEGFDTRSDLFSLGAVFYEMLTGRRAFAGSGSTEIFESLLNHDPTPFLSATPGVGPDVERICTRLLEKNLANRYGSADELIADVEAARDASTGQDQLKAYLEDPAGFVMPVEPRSSRGAEPSELPEAPEAPEVAIVPDSMPAEAAARDRTPRSTPLWRRVSLIALLLLAAAGIIYAGTAVLNVSTPDGDRVLEATGGLSAGSEEPANVDSLLYDAPDDQSLAALPEDRIVATDESPAAGLPREETAAAADQAPSRSPSAEQRADQSEEQQAAEIGRINILVDPAAEVFVDGTFVGTASGATAMPLDLTAGTHKLTLKNKYYPTHEQTVTVTPDEPQNIQVSLNDLVGRLDLRVQPWAAVYIDGDSVGITPFHPPLILTPGAHRLRLVNENWNVDWETTIIIEKKETLSREYDLKRLSNE